MHVRPHLDYCDIIYQIPAKIKETSDFDSCRSINYLMKTLESTQYQAALAVSGAWKGTNREKIYGELGWETLDHRRMFRRLVQFYKIINGLTPEFLRTPTLLLHRHLFGFRPNNVLKDIACKTDRYRNSFFPDSVSMWNDLGPELRGAETISVFKQKLLKLYRPVKKTLYNIHDNGIKWIFQLRVGLSPLKSHKKAHHFQDTPYDTCSCSQSVAETTCHFLLHCSNFVIHRIALFNVVNPILRSSPFLADEELVHLLLYGNEKFKLEDNQNILIATIDFIRNTSRFSQT